MRKKNVCDTLASVDIQKFVKLGRKLIKICEGVFLG